MRPRWRRFLITMFMLPWVAVWAWLLLLRSILKEDRA